jgi:glycosyltransferase involved in cell wall biosynthesis
MMPRILVTHPGRQHSHQAALALELQGMLAGYWAGVPAVAEQTRRVPPSLRRRVARYSPVPLPPRGVRWFPLTPALRRIGDAILPRGAAAWLDFMACRLFDRWVAARLPRRGLDAVIACEISALATFRTARRLGIVTILDAPSLHHRAQDRLHGTADSPRLHRRIVRVKDREIDLADHVLTVSALARETYLEAGVPADKVHTVALGADLQLFAPGPEQARSTADPQRGFRFLFSGAAIRRKGFDLLLDAFDRVGAAEPAAQLRLVGPLADGGRLLATRAASRISVAGPLSQPELARELREADCLVLPSRNDSFGMVVPEALASGLPVLVSDMVGAKELVAEGRNGWIVPAGDSGALAERMLWCVRHPQEVHAMREPCRSSAAAAAWPAYYDRLAALLRAIVRERAAD